MGKRHRNCLFINKFYSKRRMWPPQNQNLKLSLPRISIVQRISLGNTFEECLFYDPEVIMLSFGRLLRVNEEEAHFVKFDGICLSASSSLNIAATFFFSVYLQHLVPCQTHGPGQNL